MSDEGEPAKAARAAAEERITKVPGEFTREQAGIIVVIAGVQFVNILDFVMVMPLGPYFASIGVSQASMGYVGGAYTAAACISGLAGSYFLDRFDRRRALAISLLGLVLGTAAGGLAWSMPSLMAARFLAGVFGGPATSLALAIISDVIPVNLRGRAIGSVMGAFAAASVLGIPLGLFTAEQFSWRAPFFAVALVGVVVAVLSYSLLPPLRAHLEAAKTLPKVSMRQLVSRPLVQVSFLMTAVTMMAGFVLIPNISNYLHLNFGVPLEQLKMLYLFGGVASFVCTQAAGRLVDRFGSFVVGTTGTVLVSLVIWEVFYEGQMPFPVTALFVWFMAAMAFRNVPYNALTTKVPGPAERARFQSLQSAVQHGASALAAMLGPQFLHVVPRAPQPGDLPGREPLYLEGMPKVAIISLVCSAMIPLLLRWVERRVKPPPVVVAPTV